MKNTEEIILQRTVKLKNIALSIILTSIMLVLLSVSSNAATIEPQDNQYLEFRVVSIEEVPRKR